MGKCSCGKYASFNVIGEKPIYCAKCKTDEMIDVKNKKCPCGKKPNFNLPGTNIGICCVKCKNDDMINVTSVLCSCGKRPVFNNNGEHIGVCCAKCKTENMVNVVDKKCLCGKIPSFNVVGEKPIYCLNCKTPEMSEVRTKKCLCGKQPNFNLPGEKVGIYCVKCKTNEMVIVTIKKCPCGKIPKFNIPGETKGVACSKCKTDEMVDVMSKICPGYDRPCPVRTYLSNGHDYCMSCDPNEARRKRYKLHEEAFFDYVKDKIDVHKREFRVTFDPEYTSNKFARLDGIVFGDGVIVCLEVDEEGHEDYECDEHRMHLVTAELLQKYPECVVSWVRVNPTIDVKDQWSKKTKANREKRFEDVIVAVNDIMRSRDTRIVYIGFDA